MPKSTVGKSTNVTQKNNNFQYHVNREGFYCLISWLHPQRGRKHDTLTRVRISD